MMDGAGLPEPFMPVEDNAFGDLGIGGNGFGNSMQVDGGGFLGNDLEFMDDDMGGPLDIVDPNIPLDLEGGIVSNDPFNNNGMQFDMQVEEHFDPDAELNQQEALLEQQRIEETKKQEEE